MEENRHEEEPEKVLVTEGFYNYKFKLKKRWSSNKQKENHST